jgi:ferredoxin-type protein NapG
MRKSDAARREFLTGVGEGAALVAQVVCSGLIFCGNRRAPTTMPCVPRARDAEDFNAKCIKCGQCVRVRPYDTLQLAAAGNTVPIGTPYYVARGTSCYMCPEHTLSYDWRPLINKPNHTNQSDHNQRRAT